MPIGDRYGRIWHMSEIENDQEIVCRCEFLYIVSRLNPFKWWFSCAYRSVPTADTHRRARCGHCLAHEFTITNLRHITVTFALSPPLASRRHVRLTPCYTIRCHHPPVPFVPSPFAQWKSRVFSIGETTILNARCRCELLQSMHRIVFNSYLNAVCRTFTWCAICYPCTRNTLSRRSRWAS